MRNARRPERWKVVSSEVMQESWSENQGGPRACKALKVMVKG